MTATSGGSCRTATHAIVPLRSEPGFDLEQGGRLGGAYDPPAFTGCGSMTPLVNLVAAGSGNAVFDLLPVGGGIGRAQDRRSVSRSVSSAPKRGAQPSFCFARVVSMIAGWLAASTHWASGGRNGTAARARAAT